MDAVSLATLARVTADDFLRGRVAAFPTRFADELAAAIEVTLLTAVRAERRASVDACTRRRELWERTADRLETGEALRLESEQRAKEATYLADLIATQT
jgi:hypothetical protein